MFDCDHCFSVSNADPFSLTLHDFIAELLFNGLGFLIDNGPVYYLLVQLSLLIPGTPNSRIS